MLHYTCPVKHIFYKNTDTTSYLTISIAEVMRSPCMPRQVIHTPPQTAHKRKKDRQHKLTTFLGVYEY